MDEIISILEKIKILQEDVDFIKECLKLRSYKSERDTAMELSISRHQLRQIRHNPVYAGLWLKTGGKTLYSPEFLKVFKEEKTID